MQVGVADVDAKVAELHESQQRVQVRAVSVHQAAGIVDDARDFQDVRLEESQCAWDRQHEDAGILACMQREVFQIDIAIGIGLHGLHFEACHGG